MKCTRRICKQVSVERSDSFDLLQFFSPSPFFSLTLLHGRLVQMSCLVVYLNINLVFLLLSLLTLLRPLDVRPENTAGEFPPVSP